MSVLPSGARSTSGDGKAGGGGGGGGGGESPTTAADPGKAQRNAPPAAEADRVDCQSNPSTGTPVVIATGTKLKYEVDFVAQGLYGLSQQRTYRSSSTRSGMFGPNWWSSFDRAKLSTWGCVRSRDHGCVPSTAQVWDEAGVSVVYRHVAGTDSPFVYTASGSASGGTMTYYAGYEWALSSER